MPPIVPYYTVRPRDNVHQHQYRAPEVSTILENYYTSATTTTTTTNQNVIDNATRLFKKRQIQVTTTVTPGLGAATNPLPPVQTLTRASSLEEVPAATRPAATPLAAPAPATATATAAGSVAPSGGVVTSIRPATSSKASAKDDSVFGVNLSWWQITGIAFACVAVACMIVYLVMKRRRRQQDVDQKSKETQAEESRKAREEAARLREEAIPARMMGMGMGVGGGMGMAGGMGGGIGGYPVVLNQGAAQPAVAVTKTERRDRDRDRDRGRRKDRRRYSDSDDSWESSGTESYDSRSDGGTIKKRRRRKPRRRKERKEKERDDKRGGRKHRNGRYSDDEDDEQDLQTSTSSFFFASRHEKEKRRRKERERNRPAMPRRDATRDHPSRRGDAMSARDEERERLPMGLGPPTGSARTPYTGSSGHSGGSSGRTPKTGASGSNSASASGSGSRSGFAPTSGRNGQLDRKESKGKNWRDSVFSTYDSMKRAAVRHKYMDGKVRLQKQLEEEEKIERHRQETIKKANDELERDKLFEAEIMMKLENEKLEKAQKEREQRSVQQIANLFTRRQDSQSTGGSIPYDQETPLRIPMPQPRPTYRNDSPLPYNRSNPPSRQHTQDSPGQTRMLPPQRQFSSPASAYNSALPEKQHRPRLPTPTKRSSSELPYDAYDGVASVVSSAAIPSRPRPFRNHTPPNRGPRRQGSDTPLKSAMRTPGVRRPERKATINNHAATIRGKPNPYQSSANQESVTNDFLSDWLGGPPSTSGLNSNPYQSAIDSANLSPTGTVFIPVPRSRDQPTIKRGGLAPAPPPRARTKSSSSRTTESSSHSGGSRSGRDNGNQQPAGQGSGGGPGVANWQSGMSNGSSDNQANKRWANRLRERR